MSGHEPKLILRMSAEQVYADHAQWEDFDKACKAKVREAGIRDPWVRYSFDPYQLRWIVEAWEGLPADPGPPRWEQKETIH